MDDFNKPSRKLFLFVHFTIHFLCSNSQNNCDKVVDMAAVVVVAVHSNPTGYVTDAARPSLVHATLASNAALRKVIPKTHHPEVVIPVVHVLANPIGYARGVMLVYSVQRTLASSVRRQKAIRLMHHPMTVLVVDHVEQMIGFATAVAQRFSAPRILALSAKRQKVTPRMRQVTTETIGVKVVIAVIAEATGAPAQKVVMTTGAAVADRIASQSHVARNLATGIAVAEQAISHRAISALNAKKPNRLVLVMIQNLIRLLTR